MKIDINSITMCYAKELKALDSVTFCLEEGVFGLLGKNGAGKSTLMRILATLQKPTSGQIFFDGQPLAHTRAFREKIGYMPQDLGFHPELTIRETLDYFGTLCMLQRNQKKDRINELLENTNLTTHANKKIKQLSGGMKRRVGLAQAMLNDPILLVVDEPTAGLDPEERIRIRMLLNVFSKGKVVLLSTHVVEDVASTCKKLAILESGHLMFNGDLIELLDRARGHVSTLTIYDESEFIGLSEKGTITETHYTGSSLFVRLVHDVPIQGATCLEPNIEDAYVYASLRNREVNIG